MDEQKLWNFGPFRLDARNEQLWHEQEVLHLTNKALAVLCYLVEHQGQLVTKDDLFAAVWPEVVVSDAALVVCIRELRQTLGDERRTPRFIETVHGRGYRFIAAVAAPVPSAKFRVLSQEEESQKPALSALEGANGKVIATEIETEIGTEEAPSPDVEGHAQDSALRTQHLPAARFTRSLLLTATLLLIATVLAVQYLSLPTPGTQPLIPNTPPRPLPDKPSIVILPFINLSGDPSQEYFSDGLTAEITNTLSRVVNLFVIARTSAFTYKGRAAKVQDISRELGARYILEGSARKRNDQLRILAQLIDGTTGEQVWSESYARPVVDIFAVQDEIAQKISTTLKLQFPLWEFGLPIRKRTSNLEAYDYFLRGLDYCCRFTKEANNQARQLLERALELDPQYAEAYAVLGSTYFAEWVYQWNPDPQNLARTLALEQRALALDDSLTWAHRALSSVYLYQRQYEQSIAEAERAIVLGPNEADNYGALAESLVLSGQPERAIGYGEQALRLNPRTISFAHFSLGWAYRLVGRYEEAIAILKKFLGQYPNQLGARLNLAVAYQESGREDEARAEVVQVLRLNPNYSLEALRKMNFQKDPALAERSYAALRKAGMK